jgi:hypothetical protein
MSVTDENEALKGKLQRARAALLEAGELLTRYESREPALKRMYFAIADIDGRKVEWPIPIQ